MYKGYSQYLRKWTKTKLFIDLQTLENSYRCSPTICDFVSLQLGIPMKSHRSDEVRIIMVEDENEAEKLLLKDGSIVKLFLRESYKYDCYALNWGASKGLDDFLDICIVLNATTLKALKNSTLTDLPPETLNKLYVACTRAKGNIYFVPYTFAKSIKRE